MQNLQVIARIGKTVGIKGFNKFENYCENKKLIRKLELYADKQPIKIAEFTEKSLRVEGVDTPELARQYTGQMLYADVCDFPQLAVEEIYWFELEGMKVYSVQDEYIGTVISMFATGANDVIRIAKAGTQDQKNPEQLLVPWLKDEVVKSIDKKNRKLVVDWFFD